MNLICILLSLLKTLLYYFQKNRLSNWWLVMIIQYYMIEMNSVWLNKPMQFNFWEDFSCHLRQECLVISVSPATLSFVFYQRLKQCPVEGRYLEATRQVFFSNLKEHQSHSLLAFFLNTLYVDTYNKSQVLKTLATFNAPKKLNTQKFLIEKNLLTPFLDPLGTPVYSFCGLAHRH